MQLPPGEVWGLYSCNVGTCARSLGNRRSRKVGPRSFAKLGWGWAVRTSTDSVGPGYREACPSAPSGRGCTQGRGSTEGRVSAPAGCGNGHRWRRWGLAGLPKRQVNSSPEGCVAWRSRGLGAGLGSRGPAALDPLPRPCWVQTPGAQTPRAESGLGLRNPEQPSACLRQGRRAAPVRAADGWAPGASEAEPLRAGRLGEPHFEQASQAALGTEPGEPVPQSVRSRGRRSPWVVARGRVLCCREASVPERPCC